MPSGLKSKLDIFVILPKSFKDLIPLSEDYKILEPEFNTSNILARSIWHKLYLPMLLRKIGCDILYCPGGYLPVKVGTKTKTAVAFQNMLPFDDSQRKLHPYGYTRARLRLLREIQSSSFKDADLVVFLSEYARSVIDKTVPKRIGKSVVIPHGLSDDFRQENLWHPAQLAGIEYILYVSIITVYKAQLEVIKAWSRVRKMHNTALKLVLVGPEYGPYAKQVRELIKSLRLEQEVIMLGHVPYPELPSFYQNARINIFASSCENCPNILLEALAGGKPVLCSNYPPMPEFGGDAVEYFDPYNVEELAYLIVKYLENEKLQREMGAKAFERSLKFQWSVSATLTWNALANLL